MHVIVMSALNKKGGSAWTCDGISLDRKEGKRLDFHPNLGFYASVLNVLLLLRVCCRWF